MRLAGPESAGVEMKGFKSLSDLAREQDLENRQLTDFNIELLEVCKELLRVLNGLTPDGEFSHLKSRAMKAIAKTEE